MNAEYITFDKELQIYYGILKKDYSSVNKNKYIIMYISYKDIHYINKLIQDGYNIQIVNLKYQNIVDNLPTRLASRNPEYTQNDIEKRLTCAINYEKIFSTTLNQENILKVYTDTMGVEETYNTVIKKLERKL